MSVCLLSRITSVMQVQQAQAANKQFSRLCRMVSYPTPYGVLYRHNTTISVKNSTLRKINISPPPSPLMKKTRQNCKMYFKWETLLVELKKEEGSIAKLGSGSSSERCFPQEKIGRCDLLLQYSSFHLSPPPHPNTEFFQDHSFSVYLMYLEPRQ